MPRPDADTSPSSPAPPQVSFGRMVWLWSRPVLGALLAALFVRAFVIGAFRIPTPSMERNLLVGDFVIVSKLHYGPRLPTTLRVPFTELSVPDVSWAPVRLPGFSEVQREDVIVFNYPPEDRPLDDKTHYVKRVVGLPGDTLSIRDKQVWIDGAPIAAVPGTQYRWVASLHVGEDVPLEQLRARGVREVTLQSRGGRRFSFVAPEGLAQEIADWDAVRDVDLYVASDGAHGRRLRLFPPGAGYTPDRYGPVLVPKAGLTIELTPATWTVYRDVILRYEGRQVRRPADDRFEIDGVPTDRYTFGQDYYFVLGDNRDDSSDSRVWGFVPKSHLVGKAVLVYFSWDPETGVRAERLFKPVR